MAKYRKYLACLLAVLMMFSLLPLQAAMATEVETAEECTHPEESIVVDAAVPAGCETTGLTEGSHCGLCDKVLVEQTVTSALGHTPEETRRDAVEATADAAGYTGDLYCAVCEALLEEGEVIPQLVVEADGEEAVVEEECLHPEESIVVDEAVPAGCETTGLTEGSHCGLCDKVLVEQTVTSALGHTPEETRRNAVAATVDAAGYTGDLYCAVCEALLEEGEVIPQLVVEADGEAENEEGCIHPEESIVIDEAVPATSEADGLTEGSHCGLCNAVLVEQQVVHTPEETRRNAAEATEESEGYTGDLYCAVCEELIEEGTVIPKVGSEEGSEVEDDEALTVEEIIEKTGGEYIDISGEKGASPEELYLEYFNQLLNGSSFRKGGTPRGNNLKGNDKVLYDEVLPEIRKIAAGQRASSVFQISLDKFGFTWNAERNFYEIPEEALSLSGPAYSDSGWNNTVVEEAKSKIASMFPSISNVFYALKADCPYELYWIGSGYGNYGHAVGRYKQEINGEWHTTFTVYGGDVNGDIGTSYYFYLKTARMYQDETLNEFAVDTGKTSGAATSVTNINYIISYARTLSTDEEKMRYFKEKICEWVSYDDAAATASGNNEWYDENAWDLIYVFDEKPETNVVCEGYSKAFKYLCDELDLECYTVSGIMRCTGNATGQGRHMWNIVRIDGKNYLVDVTNCDSGTIGYPNYLFLVGKDQGSFDTGYSFKINGSTIYYTYNEETFGLYTAAELTLYGDEYVLINGRNLSLKGDIVFNFYVTLPESFVKYGGYAEVDGNGYGPEDSNRYYINHMIEDSGRYIISYPVSAKSMHDNITLQFFNLDDREYTLKSEVNGVISSVPENKYTFTFETYQTLANDRAQSGDPQFTESLMTLLDRMKEYGIFAENQFKDAPQQTITQDMLDRISSVMTGTLRPYEPSLPEADIGIQYYKSSLVLRTETAIRHYFTVTSGVIDDYEFKIGGQPATPVEKDGAYYVEIANITARNLDTVYTVTVKNADNDTLTIGNYSALSYAYKVLADNGNGDGDLVNLVKSLYLYNRAADAYFG